MNEELNRACEIADQIVLRSMDKLPDKEVQSKRLLELNKKLREYNAQGLNEKTSPEMKEAFKESIDLMKELSIALINETRKLSTVN